MTYKWSSGQLACREVIARVNALRDEANALLQQLGKSAVADYHFLDHRLSTFWDCATSPTGYCVFPILQVGQRTQEGGCRYCGNPVVRK